MTLQDTRTFYEAQSRDAQAAALVALIISMEAQQRTLEQALRLSLDADLTDAMQQDAWDARDAFFDGLEALGMKSDAIRRAVL